MSEAARNATTSAASDRLSIQNVKVGDARK